MTRSPSVPAMGKVAIRTARTDDAPRVAALHAASWMAHYRGFLSDAYLDGPVAAERAAVWRQRLDHPRSGQVVLLAEAEGVLVGFTCVFLDHDRDYGSLIDNLHVAAPHKRNGIGRLLLHSAASAMQHSVPRRPAYLLVIEGNHAARAFYERIGGNAVEETRNLEPDGSQVLALRYVWNSPAALVAGTER